MNSDFEFASFHLTLASVMLAGLIAVLILSLIFREKKELIQLLNTLILFLYASAILIFQWDYMLINFPYYFYGFLVFWVIILVLVIRDSLRFKKSRNPSKSNELY